MAYKPIAAEDAKRVFFELKGLLDAHNVDFWLGYGSLLGCVRQNSFIEGDNDIDLVFLQKEYFRVCLLLPLLKNHGFSVFIKHKRVITLVNGPVTVDLYFFSKKNFLDRARGLRSCGCGLWNIVVDDKHFEGFDCLELYGKQVKGFSFSKEWLEKVYGVDWRVPQDKKGKTHSFVSHYFMLVRYFLSKRLKGNFKLFFKKIYRSFNE